MIKNLSGLCLILCTFFVLNNSCRAPAPLSVWSITGNSGTNSGINFLGSLGPMPLVFRLNSLQTGKLDPANGNIAWGLYALNGDTNTLNYSNIGIGPGALYSNTTGHNLVAVGDSALFNQVTEPLGRYFNTAVGSKSLFANTTGTGNTAFGYHALDSITTASGNTVIGANSLQQGGGSENTVIGYNSLLSKQVAIGDVGNVVMGNNSLSANTSGSFNTTQGYGIMTTNTVGLGNVGIGKFALANNTTGSGVVAIGYSALNKLGTVPSGIFELTAAGSYALYSNTVGYANTAVGYKSMYSNTIGTGNTAVGDQTLYSQLYGRNNTVVGYKADVLHDSINNSTAIGYNAVVDMSNKIRLGNSNVTYISGQVQFTTPSSAQFKFNVAEEVKGLDFILKLRPVMYNFDTKKYDLFIRGEVMNDAASYAASTAIRRSGFVAQEVEKAARECDYDFNGITIPQNTKEAYGLAYSQFVVPLVKAVQEQQKLIESSNEQWIALQQKIQYLQNLVHPKQ